MNVQLMFESGLLLFVLLNPFLMSIYLLDLFESLTGTEFRRVLVRGAAISAAAFTLFAVGGDAIFTEVLQARFAAFLIFGGVVFLLIGVRFVMVGAEAVSSLRGSAEHVAGSIAMPFMIGPGTVSASVFAGSRLALPWSVLSILGAVACTVVSLLLLKAIYDWVQKRNEGIVQRYVEIVGRLSALLVGTIAVEMILKGVDIWLNLNGAGTTS